MIFPKSNKRVFVVGAGRCGTLTFSKACEKLAPHFTAAHENLSAQMNLVYPEGHIEVNNRLTWFLFRLVNKYPQAYIVELYREDVDAWAASLSDCNVIKAWAIMHQLKASEFEKPGTRDWLAKDYIETVRSQCYHADLKIPLERIAPMFDEFAAMLAIDDPEKVALGREVARKVHNAG